MKCEACGSEMSKGFPAVHQEGNSFNIDFVPGTLVGGKFGARGTTKEGFRKILASACDSCGRVVFHLSPKE